MSDHIDYYFTSISPFTYLGHEALESVAQKHGKTINYKPFNLFGVWEVSGAVPPMKRPLVRQRYRLVELLRIADIRGIKINPNPAHFPADPTLADTVAIAIQNTGENPGPFIGSVGKALWAEEKSVADEAVIRELLEANGHSSKDILTLAKSEEIANLRAENTQAAIDADAIGAPAYVYRGEVFWGQDRIEYLDHMIASGREAFSAG